MPVDPSVDPSTEPSVGAVGPTGPERKSPEPSETAEPTESAEPSDRPSRAEAEATSRRRIGPPPATRRRVIDPNATASDVPATGLANAIQHVLANCIKNPQAPGLLNALEHLYANQQRQGRARRREGRREKPRAMPRRPPGEPRTTRPRGGRRTATARSTATAGSTATAVSTATAGSSGSSARRLTPVPVAARDRMLGSRRDGARDPDGRNRSRSPRSWTPTSSRTRSPRLPRYPARRPRRRR